MKRKIKLSGVRDAAEEARVSKQHIYYCISGERRPSRKVADAIRKNVTVYKLIPEGYLDVNVR